jgi:putative oxidoreductase
MLGIYGDVGALMLALFVTATALLMHPYWREGEEQAKMMEQVQFNKDLGLAGGALGLFVVFAALGRELGLTITESLLEL